MALRGRMARFICLQARRGSAATLRPLGRAIHVQGDISEKEKERKKLGSKRIMLLPFIPPHVFLILYVEIRPHS